MISCMAKVVYFSLFPLELIGDIISTCELCPDRYLWPSGWFLVRFYSCILPRASSMLFSQTSKLGYVFLWFKIGGTRQLSMPLQAGQNRSTGLASVAATTYIPLCGSPDGHFLPRLRKNSCQWKIVCILSSDLLQHTTFGNTTCERWQD